MLKVRGYRILVDPEEIEKVTAGGIVLVQDERLEASGQQFGVVVGIGSTCWTDGEGNPREPWCSVGDKILFAKHAGRFVYDPETKKEYQIMLDTDVLAVVTESE